ncbi:acyltransferase family protein [Acetobacter musti]|uniref:acyltransferase family protein n=1 Tax=Acetobacter musti TaxID=864732 RepID=UPI00156B0F0B|nr:acyltransferase family protein [Acetobacter musti]
MLAAVRGIAISLVVIHHANAGISGWLLRDMPFAWGVGIFQYAAVPIFLLCAGLSISRISDNRVLLLKASVNYIYIYLLWFVISVILSGFVAKANVSVSMDLWGSLHSFCFPRGPLWFPYGLAFMLFFAALTARMDRRAQIALVIALGFLPMILHKDIVDKIFCNMSFFFIGLLYRKEIIKVLSRQAGIVFFLCLSSYIGLLLLAALVGVAYFPPIYVALGCLAFGALTEFWRTAYRPKTAFKVASVLGRAALPILVMHDFWIHAAIDVLHRFPALTAFSSPLSDRSFPLLVALFALVMSLVSYELLSRHHWLFMAPRFITTHAVTRLEQLRSAWKLRSEKLHIPTTLTAEHPNPIE